MIERTPSALHSGCGKNLIAVIPVFVVAVDDGATLFALDARFPAPASEGRFPHSKFAAQIPRFLPSQQGAVSLLEGGRVRSRGVHGLLVFGARKHLWFLQSPRDAVQQFLLKCA